MRFNIIIDVPEETILNYQDWTQKHEENLHLDFFDRIELENLIKDMVEEQTSWDIEKCELLDKKELEKVRSQFKRK